MVFMIIILEKLHDNNTGKAQISLMKLINMKRVVNTNEAQPGWDFPCSAEINWPVPQLPQNQNLFSYVPCSLILYLFPCSTQNLAFVPLFH